MTDTIRIATDALSAEFSTLGAELRVLRDEAGRDLLSDGPPEYWTGRAPFLFPIVGAVQDDHIHIDGQSYEMARHGFARKSLFALVDRQPDRATFRLEADEATRAHYPFEFRLDVTHRIEGATLHTEAVLTNPGAVSLPASGSPASAYAVELFSALAAPKVAPTAPAYTSHLGRITAALQTNPRNELTCISSAGPARLAEPPQLGVASVMPDTNILWRRRGLIFAFSRIGSAVFIRGAR